MNSITFILYLLESTLCLSILYWFYKYLFDKETYFAWNRLYFIGAAFFSLCIPFIHVPVGWLIAQVKTVSDSELLLINPEGTAYFTIKQAFEKPDWYQTLMSFQYLTVGNILLIVYLSGVVRYAIPFVGAIMVILRLIVKNKDNIRRQGIFRIVETKLQVPAFSFMRYVFINSDEQNVSPAEKLQILKHEMIHASQWHSVDVLLYECLSILFWFNPVVKRMTATLREIHEFITDKLVVDNQDIRSYSYLILKLSNKQMALWLANHFTKNKIKNRLLMLANPDSDYLRKLKFLIALPAILLVMLMFGFTKALIKPDKKPNEANTALIFPVDKDCYIVQHFFMNRKAEEVYNLEKTDIQNQENIRVSHPEITIQTADFSPVFATANGIVTRVDSIDNWGLTEIEIEIKHDNDLVSCYRALAVAKVKTGEKVAKGDTIASTGDKRLYPVIHYQLLHKNKPVNPLDFIDR